MIGVIGPFRTILKYPASQIVSAAPTSLYQFRIPRTKSRSLNPHSHYIQSRTFLDSLFNSTLGPPPLRSLTHTKRLPYSRQSIFAAIADVSGYPSFLPFAVSSSVTTRDKSGYPTRARLRVGYAKLGLEEDWDSIVSCDPKTGIVEARSAKDGNFDSARDGDGLFEVLSTKWKIDEAKEGRGEGTEVKLDVNVKFRNPVYDQMFAQVEGKVANAMIDAFEKRVRDIERES